MPHRFATTLGHWWTLVPHLARVARPPALAPSVLFFHEVTDPQLGTVRLSGRLSALPSATLVVVVHGLGGSSESGYVQAMSNALQRVGWATLRLNLRGADLLGEDYYHAGLYADLLSVLTNPLLQSFSKVAFVGFSLGGHVCLKLAAEAHPATVKAVASVSAPLDLAQAARFFDERAATVYRRYVLSSLKAMFASVAKRRATVLPPAEAARIHRIRDWDERIVAPRHGFDSADHYYASVSVSNAMARIHVPTLVLHAQSDPMVGMSAVAGGLACASPMVLARLAPTGGHVGFPSSLDLGQNADLGAENQIVSWLARYV